MERRKLIVSMSCLAIMFLGTGHRQIAAAQDQAEAKGKKEYDVGGIKIFEEEGPAGHSTIGIDESTVSHEGIKELPLTFRELMKWDYGVEDNSPPPDEIVALDGRKVRLVGFMYPLQEGKELQYFCLLRSTQTCCYGPRPQYNQYVFVEMNAPTKFHRLDPVSCIGNIFVEPNPDEGFIYRMEGQMCRTVSKGESE